LIATRSFALIDNILAIAAALSQSLPLRGSAPRGLFVPIIAPATINSMTAQKLPSAAANSAA
jgi:hypothetical protein